MATRDFHANNFRAAKTLRRTPTATEDRLWGRLRHRQRDDLKFRRQHPVSHFVLDFYCSEKQPAVEIDGEVHLAPSEQALDAERQAFLEERGIRFLRVPAADVVDNLSGVLTRISEVCATLSPPLHRSGEGIGG